MIGLTKEGSNCDYCEFVINRRSELEQLNDTYNGNTIGHGSAVLCLEDASVHIYCRETHTWIELA